MSLNRALDESLARLRLGVPAGASAAELRAAFNRAVKAVHPDLHGGDGARLRDVIEAFRSLEPAPDAAVEQAPCFPLAITIAEAMRGGWINVDAGPERFLSVRLPSGLRQGERVRISGRLFEVEVTAQPGFYVDGDDVVAEVRVDPTVLLEGGRIVIGGPAGKSSIWVSKIDGAKGSVRLTGRGLPARGVRPSGDLVVRLKAAERERFDSLAQTKRRRFAAAWAA